MQQNYRQLGLHSIIKSQQAKIHQLKQQIRTYNERQQQRYSQFIKDHQYVVQQKEKAIEHLKNQLAQGQDNNKVTIQDLALESNRIIMKQKQNMETQIRLFKDQYIELENKCRTIQKECQIKEKEYLNKEKEYQNKEKEYLNREKEYLNKEKQYQHKQKQLQTQVREVSQFNKRLIDDLNHLSRNKHQINLQIEQLNNFYYNSVAQLPKRQNTLLWVDKLVNYMQTSQQIKQNDKKQTFSFVKTQLEALRTQLLSITSKGAKAETQTGQQIKKAVQYISTISKQSKQVISKISKENEQFWQVSKKQKQGSYRQQVQKLEIQLKAKEARFEQQFNYQKNTIKNMENERKTLLLGLQELKNLNQSRQKTYKQEISLLRQAIEQMTNNSEHRQAEFQQEMRNLGNQIDSLSQRYYQNIQNPNIKSNQNIILYLNKVKTQLSSLQSNKEFNNVLRQLGTSMNIYASKQTSPNSFSSQMNSCLQKNKEIIQQLQKIALRQDSFYQEYTSNFNSSSSKINNMDSEIRMIQAKQRENKAAYDISLLRRHNQKLKEHCQTLEKKIKTNKIHTHTEVTKIMPYEKRILQLQSQNQTLRQYNKKLETSIKQEFEQLKKSVYKFQSQIPVPTINKPEQLASRVDRLIQINQQLLSALTSSLHEEDRIIKSLNILNNMLAKPVETFEQLIMQALKLKENVPGISQSNPRLKRNFDQTSIKSSYSEILKNYKNIISKRNDNTVNTQKHVSELIKAIRETMPSKSKHLPTQQNERQLQKLPPQAKSKIVIQSQKKMREIQSLRIKDRQQLQTTIEKFQSLFKSIESKTNSKKSGQIFAKFETIIDKKISSVIKQVSESKQSSSNQTFLKIAKEALKDMQSKLKETLLENQGIIKEIATVNKIKRLDQKA